MEVKKMRRLRESGKIKFSSVLIVAIIFYGGFCVVKIVSANIMSGQIKNDIIEQIGYLRGPSFTVEAGEKIIREILKKNNVLESDLDPEYDAERDEGGQADDTQTEAGSETRHQKINIRIDRKSAMVYFYADYHYEINFFFFKQLKYYEVKGEVQNWN
jgi:hypothetical protein